MSEQEAYPAPALGQKPYGLIGSVLHERWRAAEGGAVAEPPPDAAGRPELLRWCRRLGAIPKSWSGPQAGRGVRAVLRAMAEGCGCAPDQVAAELLEFCSEESASSVCREAPRCAECPIEEHCDYPDRRPTIKDLPRAERPRERLLRGGEEQLSDVELLALIIGGGSTKGTALDLAGRLLSTFEGFRRLARCSIGELTRVHGIGPAKAARIKAAMGIARRYAGEDLPPGTRVEGSEQLFRYMREKLAPEQREHFCSLMLDTKHRILREELVAVGSLNESVVHPREVFKSAIAESAAAVIFVHNHPSGNPEPSPQDRRLTERLCQAGELVGIRVLDHLIVGTDGYFSFAEHGLLRPAARPT
jgi:DNA repair protein RadC